MSNKTNSKVSWRCWHFRETERSKHSKIEEAQRRTPFLHRKYNALTTFYSWPFFSEWEALSAELSSNFCHVSPAHSRCTYFLALSHKDSVHNILMCSCYFVHTLYLERCSCLLLFRFLMCKITYTVILNTAKCQTVYCMNTDVLLNAFLTWSTKHPVVMSGSVWLWMHTDRQKLSNRVQSLCADSLSQRMLF